MSSACLLGAGCLIVAAACGKPSPTHRPAPLARPALELQASGTAQRLQAVSPVSSRVVWASGLGGTWALTLDGGNTWRNGTVAGSEQLEFRDVHGVSDKVAYLLAAGTGPASRIFKTTDGGKSWALQFQNRIPDAFYDCFDFWTPERGLAVSDAVDGRFPALQTTDGRTWHSISERMPRARDGEVAFAASGSCLTTHGEHRAWIATGGPPGARILFSGNGGRSWEAYPAPLVSGTGAGGFSIAFRDSLHGMVAGGDLEHEDATAKAAASSNGGRSWKLVTPPPFQGAVFGLSYVPSAGRQFVLATGPGGTAWSRNEGESWELVPGAKGFWAVACIGGESCWLVGTEGRILRLSWEE